MILNHSILRHSVLHREDSKFKKNELIKSRALKGNQDIKNTFSSQTGTVYAVLPMHGLIGGAAQNYDGETDLKSETQTHLKEVLL